MAGFRAPVRALRRSFASLWQGPILLQLCAYGVLLVVLVTFLASYPAGLSPWRFSGTIGAIVALLAANLFWIRPPSRASAGRRAFQDWSFLILSAALVFVAVGLSGQSSIVYLLSIVCGQATFKRGVWPAGALFGAAILALWPLFQAFLATPFYVILGTEAALAAGIVFLLLFITLLKRYASATKRAERLLEELQEAHRELEASRERERELAVSEERLRLARDLHDSVTQRLYGITLYAQAADESLGGGERDDAAAYVRELRAAAMEALREMRLLLFGLQSAGLSEGGLIEALRARIAAVEARGGVRTQLITEGTESLPQEERSELYHLVTEALNNALKHARATKVRIAVRFTDESVEAEVQDDGVGFDPTDDESGGGFGLRGMRDRAEKIGGALRIESAPGAGTLVFVRAPVGAASARASLAERERWRA